MSKNSKLKTKNSKLERKRELARERQRRHRENAVKGIVVRGGVTSLNGRKAALAISSQLISTASQSSVVSAMNSYEFRKVDGGFYEMLREAVPIFDAAITQSIILEGFLKPIGEKAELVKDLEDFFREVPVNDMEKGIQAFHANASNEKFEQGFVIGEFVANKKRDDIDRLVVADSKSIFFRRNREGRIEPWFRSGTPKKSGYTMPGSIIDAILNAKYGQSVSNGNGVTETRLTPDNKLYFSIGNENQDPHGVSIMRSTEFVSQILVTIQNGFKHIAERYGDPMHHVHYKSGKSGGDIETRRKAIEDDFNAIVTAKRKGKSGDLVTAGGPDSDVTVNVIGGNGQIYVFDIPLRHLEEQIIAKTNLPAWLLAKYWNSTERMAVLEIEAALAAARIRQLAMLPEYIRLCSNFLRLRGRTWKSITTSLDQKGDWGLIFESPSYRDLMTMANARFLNAQASLMERGQSNVATATSIQVGGATFDVSGFKERVSRLNGSQTRNDSQTVHKHTCSCGKSHRSHLSHSSHDDIKELHRAIPWPDLDKIEGEYEARLKTDWKNLQDKVFEILKLKLPDPKVSSVPSVVKAFEFTDEQRAAIMKALRGYLGIYNSDDADSPVRWYYAQSYSLGLIKAAQLVGTDRPLLDILQNRNIYAELVNNGFQLVKDNATLTIRNEILDQMENLMLQGANPRDVARKLSGIFDAQNSDWERLARTEMAGAAESAKLDEWQERGVDVSSVYNTSVGGAIVPVHPRCRCSTNVRDDGSGNLRAVFAPAPDACAWCLSLVEGR